MMCRRRTFLFVVFVGVVGVCRGQQDPSPKHVLTSVPGFEGFSEQAYSVSMVEQNDLSDPEVRRRLAQNYVQEAFFTENNPPIELPTMLLLSNTSHLLRDPKIIKHFAGRVLSHDVESEIANSDGEFFGPVYRQEEQLRREKEESDEESESDFSRKLALLRLKTVFSVPRNHRMSEVQRLGAGDFISRKLGEMGMVVGLQQFAPSQFHKSLFGSSVPNLPLGTNLFGLLPGSEWGGEADRAVVVGAHWDTYEESGGMDDNGSGVVALLEVARRLTSSRCKAKNSVFFVAFDLEEFGGQGSLQFVDRYLIPEVLRKFNQLGISGAIIADTIMNYNSTPGSQEIYPEMRSLTPVAAAAVEEGARRGDFIDVFKREGFDDGLSGAFSRHWKRKSPYRLVESSIKLSSERPPSEELEEALEFLRSDHSRFWLSGRPDYPSLPAILLTDTGPYRGVMKQCYHSACDSALPLMTSSSGKKAKPAFADLKEEDLDFFMSVVAAMEGTVREAAGGECHKEESEEEKELPDNVPEDETILQDVDGNTIDDSPRVVPLRGVQSTSSNSSTRMSAPAFFHRMVAALALVANRRMQAAPQGRM